MKYDSGILSRSMYLNYLSLLSSSGMLEVLVIKNIKENRTVSKYKKAQDRSFIYEKMIQSSISEFKLYNHIKSQCQSISEHVYFKFHCPKFEVVQLFL